MTNKFYMTNTSLTNDENTPPPIPSPSEGGGWGGGDKFIFKVIPMTKIQNPLTLLFSLLGRGLG
jgi:hypothetical protein